MGIGPQNKIVQVSVITKHGDYMFKMLIAYTLQKCIPHVSR